MPDLAMSVQVGRNKLNLPHLEINDHVNYACAAQFFGTGVTWNRQQVASPQVDGQFTVNRQRSIVTEQVAVEVMGESITELRANLDQLVTAVTVDDFDIWITIDGELFQYDCEAADYQVSWVGSRFVARQLQVVLSIPRQPVPVVGVV